MSDRAKTKYTSRVSVHVTQAMNERLDQVARLRDEAKAEVVRAALRAYVDDQADLLSSRKHFTKMFQRRITYIERLLAIVLNVNVQSYQVMQERITKRRVPLAEVLEESIRAGLAHEDELYTLVEYIRQSGEGGT